MILGDAHISDDEAESGILLRRFLKTLEGSISHLVVNGDLFEFWFEYRSVIPMRVFRTLNALYNLRASGVELTVIGGNHDRWGGRFWRESLGARFLADGGDLELNGMRVRVLHGDGLAERHLGGRVLHTLTRLGLVRGAFRALHPDLGLPLVDRMSSFVADSTRSPEEAKRAAHAQQGWALRVLESNPPIDALVMGHTHLPALVDVGPRRYANHGAWFDGGRYLELRAGEFKLMQLKG